MWDMAQSSITLFFRGKLFADPNMVYAAARDRRSRDSAVLIVLAKVGAPLWFAALLAGLVGGALQPYLFKDLRYR